MFLENTKKFTEATGVDVQVDFAGWEDLRPKTAVAANVGSGPDIVLAWSRRSPPVPDKLLDLTDSPPTSARSTAAGARWPRSYGTTRTGAGSRMPIGASGGRFVYRKSWVNEAGYDSDAGGSATASSSSASKLKESGHPPGLALGNAVGDGNAWCNWVVWAHGGALVDENDQVVIDSPETVEALKYAKALYETFIPGTLSWLDPNNNKAFLAGEIWPDAERHLGLLRRQELRGSGDPGSRRGHLPCPHADRAGRAARPSAR